MRRRLRLATIAAVLVAVVLLGIPLMVFAIQVTQRAALLEIEARRDNLGDVMDIGLQIGYFVPESTIARYANSHGEVPARITVIMPDGTRVVAGEEVTGRSVTRAAKTPGGVDIEFTVSWWDLQTRSATAIGLVLLASAIAIAAGALVGSWQATRLAGPLVYLAASAEQLGSGQVRPRLGSSGIEEIDLVAEELSRSAERMARRLAAEREFAADASHQLRTPLTALSMRLEEIEALTDSKEVREEARISLEQIERLSATISELLGRSAREGISSTLEALPLADITGQQAEEWEPVFAAAGRAVQFDVPPDLGVLATPGALSQVIATLLENSLKHGGGTTELSARKASRGVAVVVRDEGNGVSDELAPHIFERHVTSGGGTGLGLALARDLAAHDGGRLELSERRPAVFTLFLRAVPRITDSEVILPSGPEVDPSRRGRLL
ncbi:MAG: HAMP domain-containing histidine kinase [Bifidobacteriaceae bacterium]|nr:HAMP domain-containing histidine kinase [Bifidobacteriaceae bacterium]